MKLDYYQNYKGPNLTEATLNDIDITSIIQEKYGENNNWNGKLWKYKEFFGNESYVTISLFVSSIVLFLSYLFVPYYKPQGNLLFLNTPLHNYLMDSQLFYLL